MTRLLAFALLAAACAAVTRPIRADGPQDEMGAAWAKNWVAKNKEFLAQQDKAKAAVLAKFDKAIAGVDQVKALTPAARADRRNELQDGRKQFEKYGKFPGDDDFIPAQLDYSLKVNKAAAPLAALVDEVIEKGARTRDASLEKLGVKLKAEHETRLGGASRMTAGSVWHGELRRGGGSVIPYHLNVGKMGDGGLFKGHVEDNPGVAGNWAYDVEGQTRGLAVEYKLTKSVRGNFTAATTVGIVSGDRLVAKIVTVAGRGRPAEAYLVLTRVR